LSFVQPADAAARGSVNASSTHTDDEGGDFRASNAIDGLLGSGWAAEDRGEGGWIEVDLGKNHDITEFSIWPGNLVEGAKSFGEYGRPRTITVTLMVRGEPVEREVVIENRMYRVDIPIEGQARRVRVDVTDVYEGGVFSQLHIAEVAINFNSSRSAITPLVTWVQSDRSDSSHQAHITEVEAAEAAVGAAEFGDMDTLRFLMGQAGDGAEYIRAQARRLVDAGYLAAAIRPDLDARDALRRIKDPNSISAFELAALRSTGDRATEMWDLVEYFYAYRDLIGGARRNLPYWGTSGWELGALRSFGEPVPVEVDDEGNIYVADIGNHRIQRFTADGRAERQWGPEAGITSEWFTDGRDYYVAGAVAGDAAGSFLTPLDVELIPEKDLGGDGDSFGFASLDSQGRVQIFDADGNGVIGWTVDFASRIDDAVGGEGYLAYIPSLERLYVILGRDMVAFSLDGEEIVRTELEDGTPNAVEVAPKRLFRPQYLIMAYGRDLVRYDADGFRFGVVLDDSDLDPGYEDMDVTVDENGFIWIVTDKGWAYKYSSNLSELLYKVRFSDLDLIHPRVAVSQDYIFCVDRDRVIRLDAEQARLDAETEAQQ
jgi:hypothetical protein